MSDLVGGGMQDSISGAQQGIAHDAQAHDAQDAAEQVSEYGMRGRGTGVAEARAAIRAQPITAALVVFVLGYLLGSLLPSRRWTKPLRGSSAAAATRI